MTLLTSEIVESSDPDLLGDTCESLPGATAVCYWDTSVECTPDNDGRSVDCLGGRLLTFETPKRLKIVINLSSTVFASVPTKSNCSSLLVGNKGTNALRAPSSPCVNVVSIPLPE